MNNDLISREALKKAITEATYNFEQIPIRVDKVMQIIDNAPTVEERPQGEWIEFADYVARNVVNEDFSEDVDFYAEVICRKLVKLGLVKLDGDTYKYCGADMRGKEE